MGHPLDINSLLYMPDGRPRHSVFYIAHLSDEERMFIVTLLYSAVETWMRAQAGVDAGAIAQSCCPRVAVERTSWGRRTRATRFLTMVAVHSP